MTPQMQEILYQLSVCFDPEPEVIFQRIVEAVGDYYGKTMAMINVNEGSRVRFRAAVNPLPALERMTWLSHRYTYCSLCLRDVSPLLIQNAMASPEYTNHPALRFGMNRYLGVPICTPSGDAIGTLCFVDDRVNELLGEEDIRFLSQMAVRVSVEMERERLVKEQIAEHRAHAERMAQMNAQLAATAEEKRRFVAMILHDLRHPLTTMQTVLYLLEKEEDAEERTSYMNLLENRVGELAHQLDALLEYDQIEAGHLRLHRETLLLEPLILECLEGFAPAFIGEEVEFSCDIAANLGEVETDRGKLTHILLNLLSNALKFTARGKVTVRARRKGNFHWTLEVEDTGPGISQEDCGRIFEEFYRTTAAQGKRGTGLGLAIVHQLARALQATLSVQSEAGQGTCFCLTFPRCLGVSETSRQD